MNPFICRYRIRTKGYLCLTASEAVNTGITVGEQTIEELILVRNPLLGCSEYAVIRETSEEDLRKVPPRERGERTFFTRQEALEHLASLDANVYQLYGVKESRSIGRETVVPEEEPMEDFMNELKAFEQRQETAPS